MLLAATSVIWSVKSPFFHHIVKPKWDLDTGSCIWSHYCRACPRPWQLPLHILHLLRRGPGAQDSPRRGDPARRAHAAQRWSGEKTTTGHEGPRRFHNNGLLIVESVLIVKALLGKAMWKLRGPSFPVLETTAHVVMVRARVMYQVDLTCHQCQHHVRTNTKSGPSFLAWALCTCMCLVGVWVTFDKH